MSTYLSLIDSTLPFDSDCSLQPATTAGLVGVNRRGAVKQNRADSACQKDTVTRSAASAASIEISPNAWQARCNVT